MQQFIYKNHPIQFDFDDNYNKYENKHTEKQTIFINNIIKNKNKELQEKFTTTNELLEKLSEIYYNRYIETINKGNAVAYNTFLQTQNPKENIYYKQYL